MRLSTKGRYAVMAMADLAAHGEGARPVSLADIAERQEISLSYLEQLFAKLRRGGLVVSVRGPGGGYRLSRVAGEIRIADIIVAVDEPITATRCQKGSPKGCMGTSGRCVTHDLWKNSVARSMSSCRQCRWATWWRSACSAARGLARRRLLRDALPRSQRVVAAPSRGPGGDGARAVGRQSVLRARSGPRGAPPCRRGPRAGRRPDGRGAVECDLHQRRHRSQRAGAARRRRWRAGSG